MHAINIVLVAAGIALFLVALRSLHRARREVGGFRASWAALTVLVVGFLVGYGLWLELLVEGRELVEPESLVSQVFFWGAVFVLLTARLFERGVGVLRGALVAEREADAERLDLERRVLHAQKLESLGVLAGGIAHDFNNLLVGMLGYASLAQDELPSGSPARDHLARIEASARRAADLTRQLLAYSGKGRFVVEPLDLSAVVEEMTHLVEVTLCRKAALKLDLEGDLPPVQADAAQVRQVVLNLVTNASDAIGEDCGIITVSTGWMRADERYLDGPWLPEAVAPGEYVYLEVSDTGRGMDAEAKERMFEPFFSTKGTGRGLGLSAVLGIVSGHRGAMRVYSEPGRGTTIKVLLPAAGGPEAPSGAAGTRVRGIAPPPHGGVILIADDEQTVRELAGAVLAREGYEVLTAADGAAALEVFERRGGKVDLVLLDMTMPQLNGAETYSRLRRLRSEVPVILSSGYNEQDATSRFAGKGLAGFLRKPWTAEGLRDAVRGVLGGTDDDG